MKGSCITSIHQTFGPKTVIKVVVDPGLQDLMRTMTLTRDHHKRGGNIFSKSGSLQRGSNRTLAWLIDPGLTERHQRELTSLQSKLFDLSAILEKLKAEAELSAAASSAAATLPAVSSSNTGSPKRYLRFGRDLRRKRSQANQVNVVQRPTSLPQSSSNPNLLLKECHNNAIHSTTLPQASTTSQTPLNPCQPTQRNCSSAYIAPVSPRPYHSLNTSVDLSSTQQHRSPPLAAVTGTPASATQRTESNGQPVWTHHKEFISESTQVLESLRRICRGLQTEKDKLRQAIERSNSISNLTNSTANVSPHLFQTINNSLQEALRQNTDLRGRLARVRGETDHLPSAITPVPSSAGGSVALTGVSGVGRPGTPGVPLTASSSVHDEVKSLAMVSKSMSIESVSERFFDTAEHLASEASTSASESDDDDGNDDSDPEAVSIGGDDCSLKNKRIPLIEAQTGRRENLPSPQPDTSSFSLMNLLCKNIGRDLSRIRLPVILNEPLGTLQRLCEELEYSELLDTASTISDPVERMVYVAAFAVSCYASTYYRSGTKPFNPLLYETYEYIREDKGWKFIAEQVSHHPPISACHCQSDHWTFWQELRLKNKFWGKSLEAVPMGSVHLKIPRWNEQYQWNKVTSCVHNIFSPQQRYVDHYGEMVIEATSGVVCRLSLHKANSWTGRRYEVSGVVYPPPSASLGNSGWSMYNNHQVSGKPSPLVQQQQKQMFGKWNEGIYCGQHSTAKCIWRPGVMPEDHEIYYGFTRFAIELNEYESSSRQVMPTTDSRLRPDQRLLEEGRVAEAEAEKMRLETAQRERAQSQGGGEGANSPVWFRKVATPEGKTNYEFTGQYWQCRQDRGFMKMNLPKLW